MCPGTLALAATAAQAAGSVISGVSAASSALYQAQVSRNNAKTAQNNANYTAAAGAAQTENAGLRARSANANTRASLAAQNVDVSSGSAADVQTSQAELSRLDTETIANRAAMETYGYRVQNISDTAQSKADQSAAIWDVAGGVTGAAGKVAGAAPDLPTSLLSGPSGPPSGYTWMVNDQTLPSSVDEEFGSHIQEPGGLVPAGG